jgi:hypothetical protein
MSFFIRLIQTTCSKDEFFYPFDPDDLQRMKPFYNKALWMPDDYDGTNLVDDNGNPVSVLNSDLDTDKIQRQWFGEYDKFLQFQQ